MLEHEEKETKGIQIGKKKVKSSTSVYSVILYLKNIIYPIFKELKLKSLLMNIVYQNQVC